MVATLASGFRGGRGVEAPGFDPRTLTDDDRNAGQQRRRIRGPGFGKPLDGPATG